MWTPERRELIYNSAFVGANLERMDLRGMDLRGANFTNANLRGADLSYANLRHAIFIKADLSRASLHQTRFDYADMTDADLTMSYGRATNFYKARLWCVKFRRVTYKNCFFCEADLTDADFVGAELLGSKFDGAKLNGIKNTHRATFHWWVSPYGLGPSKISYEPIPGYRLMDESATKGWSNRENAAREKIEYLIEKGHIKND